jgi:ribosomal protein S18 acetylase RimI-like enzyme
MTATVVIREATEADIPAIQRVARETWAFTYEGVIPPEIQELALSSWYSCSALSRQIHAKTNLFIVAETGATCLAFAEFVVQAGDAAELVRIYVLPARHGHSIGTQLLEEGLSWLRRAGIPRLTVDVEEQNPIGRLFYERKGFAEVSKSMQKLFGHELCTVSYERVVR